MWDEVAKAIAGYPGAVLNALDADGNPFSVRQREVRYDPVSGRLPVVLPESLRPVEGRASLLCHRHDEAMAGMSSIQVRGSLARQDGAWVFVSSAFTPPPRWVLWDLAKRMRAASRAYLADRRAEPPEINWGTIRDIWGEVRAAGRGVPS